MKFARLKAFALATSIVVIAGPAKIQKASAADARPYPGHQCMGECSPSILKIWNLFEAGANLDPQVSGRVFSGECHMKGVNYDGETAHHGVAYFSPSDNALPSPESSALHSSESSALHSSESSALHSSESSALHSSESSALHFEGRFTFFGSGNPYANWSVTDALRELNPKNDPLSLITFDESFAWVDFHPGQVPMMQYYFRQSPSSDIVYLVGIWGDKNTLFCEFSPNL